MLVPNDKSVAMRNAQSVSCHSRRVFFACPNMFLRHRAAKNTMSAIFNANEKGGQGCLIPPRKIWNEWD